MARKKPAGNGNYTNSISVWKALLIFGAIIFGVGIIHTIATPASTNAPQPAQQSPQTQENTGSQQPTTVTIPPSVQQKLQQQTTPSYSQPSATTDSSGFDAGYSYAEQYQICDPNYDNGNSQDFNNGVNAWTADNCTDGQLNDTSGN